MGQKQRVAVVVDSAASLPANVGGNGGPYVVPMQLTIDGRNYLDGRELTPTAFYRMQRGMRELPTTASPSPADFLSAFQSAAHKTPSILCLTISPRFSSSHDSARTAIQAAKDAVPQAQIVVLDTESAAGGEGLIAMEALRAAQRGDSLEGVTEAARAVIPKVTLLAFLETLYYVWRSGRVPKVAYAGTSLLRIKPLFELYRGEIRTLARPRTSPRAADRLTEIMRQRAGPGPVHATVMHAGAVEAAERLIEKVGAKFTCEELFISEFSPVMGTHTGPGLLGIAFWSEDAGGQPA